MKIAIQVAIAAVSYLCWMHLAFAASAVTSVDVVVRALDTEISRDESILVEVSYTNVSNSSVVLLTWGTALETPLGNQLLRVIRNGQEMDFLSIIVKREAPQVADYINLAAGETVSRVIDISERYNFSQAGQYTLYPNAINARLRRQEPATIRVLDQRPARKIRPNFTQCTGSEASSTDAALGRAESFLQNAVQSMSQVPESARAGAPRYTTWFGQYSLGNWNRVYQNLVRMRNAAAGRQFTFDCECVRNRPNNVSVNAIAYVYPSLGTHIFFCSGFFFRELNTRAEVMVHEISHFNNTADTDDIQYGEQNGKTLAGYSPTEAARNADNYAHFARNREGLSMPTGGGSNGGGDDGGSGSGDDQPGEGDGNVDEPLPMPEPEKPTPMTSIFTILMDEDD